MAHAFCCKRQLTLIATLLATLAITACSNPNSGNNEPLVGRLKKDQPYFAISMDSVFAKRFGLPEQQARQLSNGLRAVAVEIRPRNTVYQCFLHLYLDADLAIYTPSGGDFSDKSMAEMFFVNRYNETDQDWNFDAVASANLRMLFRSKSTAQGKSGMVSALKFDRVKTNFLPGLTLVSSNVGCDTLDPQYGPAEVRIQKLDMENYLLGDEVPGSLTQPDSSFVFDIPLPLLQHLQSYLDFARRANIQHRDSDPDLAPPPPFDVI